MSVSMSHCQGKGSLAHNNRTFCPKNVDGSRTEKNITYANQPIAQAYDDCFSSAVERYNARQTRACRRIETSYFESTFKHTPSNSVVTSSDKRKSFYEDLIQIGDKNDCGCGTELSAVAIECLDEYARGFQARNPNFYVFNSVLHVDECTPHLHIDYIPIGHYKSGIDTRNGIAQALKEMGYGSGADAISRWRTAECKVLSDICAARGIEIKAPQKSRGTSYTPQEYKAMKDEVKAEIIKDNPHIIEDIRAVARAEVIEDTAEYKEMLKSRELWKSRAMEGVAVLEMSPNKSEYVAQALKEQNVGSVRLNGGICVPNWVTRSKMFEKIEKEYRPPLAEQIAQAQERSEKKQADEIDKLLAELDKAQQKKRQSR